MYLLDRVLARMGYITTKDAEEERIVAVCRAVEAAEAQQRAAKVAQEAARAAQERAEAAERAMEALQLEAAQMPAYLVKNDPGETVLTYKRRLQKLFVEHRKHPLFLAILDEAGRHERQAWDRQVMEPDPVKAEQARIACRTMREFRHALRENAYADLISSSREAATAQRLDAQKELYAGYGRFDLDRQMANG